MKTTITLEEYIDAAISSARFEKIENGQKIYAEVPGLKGVWAEGRTRTEVVKELRGTLTGWIELQLERGYKLPPIKGSTPRELTFA